MAQIRENSNPIFVYQTVQIVPPIEALYVETPSVGDVKLCLIIRINLNFVLAVRSWS
jgi:hypothetical protein